MTSIKPADLETVLLIAVPDLPKVIRDTRLRLDPEGALGVPEHVTVRHTSTRVACTSRKS